MRYDLDMKPKTYFKLEKLKAIKKNLKTALNLTALVAEDLKNEPLLREVSLTMLEANAAQDLYLALCEMIAKLEKYELCEGERG